MLDHAVVGNVAERGEVVTALVSAWVARVRGEGVGATAIVASIDSDDDGDGTSAAIVAELAAQTGVKPSVQADSEVEEHRFELS